MLAKLFNTRIHKNVRDLKIYVNDLLVSFDVKDLFPSINTEEISEVVNNKIQLFFRDKEIANTLIKTSNLVMQESYFAFNGEFFKQSMGVYMRSPISGSLAEQKIENIRRINIERK